jgi:hypothetical protein
MRPSSTDGILSRMVLGKRMLEIILRYLTIKLSGKPEIAAMKYNYLKLRDI